jgi:rod shape-determining protein MreD
VKYLFLAAAIFLTFFLQGRISVLGISPDLSALLIFFAGMRYGETRGLLLGILTGALEDGLSGSLIGPHMLSKGIIGFSSSFFISGGFFRWTPVLGAIAVALLTVSDNFIVFLTRTVFDKMPATLPDALFVTVMQALLNTPAGIFIGPKHVD